MVDMLEASDRQAVGQVGVFLRGAGESPSARWSRLEAMLCQ